MKLEETMDFLSALEKALQLGVSKEEFMNYWEAEQKDKKSQVNNLRLATSHDQVYPAPDNTDQSDHRPWTLEEFQNQIQQKYQLSLDQLLDSQRRLWEDSRHEWSKQLDLMCQMIKTMNETHAGTLKHFIMQEMELLKQDLLRFLSQHQATLANGDDPDLLRASPQGQVTGSTAVKIESEQEIASISQSDSQGSQFDLSGDVVESDSLPDRKMEEVNKLSWELEAGDFQETQDPTPAHNYKIGTKFVGKVYSGRQQKTTSVLKGNNLGESGSGDASIKNSSVLKAETSKAATGFYADVISQRMKVIDQQTVRQRSPVKYTGADELSNVAPVRCSSSSLKFNGRFTVDNCDSLGLSSTNLSYSPFVHSANQSWKARVSVSFNEKKQLKVNILIAAGENVDAQIWPLQFKGTGSVYQRGSKRFTPIWQIEPTVCQKPETTKGTVLPTTICLSTARGEYPDITYQDLVYRKYIDDNTLAIDWNIQCKGTRTVAHNP